MTMTSIDIESETHNIEKQIDIPNIDILKTLKQAVFDAFKQKPKKTRKITNADMTPEQILMKRANRMKWYRANKEHVKNYIKN